MEAHERQGNWILLLLSKIAPHMDDVYYILYNAPKHSFIEMEENGKSDAMLFTPTMKCITSEPDCQVNYM